jgi:hypothetical protein
LDVAESEGGLLQDTIAKGAWNNWGRTRNPSVTIGVPVPRSKHAISWIQTTIFKVRCSCRWLSTRREPVAFICTRYWCGERVWDRSVNERGIYMYGTSSFKLQRVLLN